MKNRKAIKPESPVSPAPRKRRRRAVGSAAADDCFTCATRQVRCDRRRPYCTQCLDLGRQCSGYKTTLTWGIGVASRGKLRGLSLPVSKDASSVSQQNIAKTDINPAAAVTFQPGEQLRTTKDTGTTSNRTPPLQPSSAAVDRSTATATITFAQSHNFVTENGQTKITPSRANSSAEPLSAAPLTSNGPDPIPSFPYPIHQNRTHSLTDTSPPIPLRLDCAPPSRNCVHPVSAPPSRLYSTNSYFQGGALEPISPALSDMSWPRKRSREEHTDEYEVSVEMSSSASKIPRSAAQYWNLGSFSPRSCSPSQPFSSEWIGRSPRMRYLIGYYTEVIAPVVVTFDSPTNPFRMYILELARESETLQHAIAALSLSNLRQRRKYWAPSTGKTLPSRRSLQAHYRITDRTFEEAFGMVSPDDQLKEESFHKAMAVKSINAHLADPVQRRTDAVLATLLILCMFHMCDTGVASFRTQFAGVKKLLAIRGAGKKTDTSVMKWFTRMFTWFDTLTATINDRESQLNGSLLEVTAAGEEEWALENLSGCDSRLFRIIARLGRLSQLSQMKPVDSTVSGEKPVATAVPPSPLQHYPPYAGPRYPVGTTIPFPDELPAYHSSIVEGYQDMDPRVDFWREWRAMRQKLESWRIGIPDPSIPTSTATGTTPTAGSIPSPTASPSASTPASALPSCLSHVLPSNFLDVTNISESFRYAALIYLERLANPHIPSNHPRIQTLVTAALHYITAVQSDVFLLWPLFITGSECYLDADRAVIRHRCSDIQKDSGFVNNLSCLQLLEKIWKRNDPNTPASPPDAAATVDNTRTAQPALGGESFRWRRIIDSEKITDEYIVI